MADRAGAPDGADDDPWRAKTDEPLAGLEAPGRLTPRLLLDAAEHLGRLRNGPAPELIRRRAPTPHAASHLLRQANETELAAVPEANPMLTRLGPGTSGQSGDPHGRGGRRPGAGRRADFIGQWTEGGAGGDGFGRRCTAWPDEPYSGRAG